jgi:hypothetical protein
MFAYTRGKIHNLANLYFEVYPPSIVYFDTLAKHDF